MFLIGGLVSAVAGVGIGSVAGAQNDALAAREVDGVSALSATFEQRQLLQLRVLTTTPGLGAAVTKANPQALRDLLLPLLAGQVEPELQLSVVGRDSREMLRLLVDPEDGHSCICSAGSAPLAWPHVDDVLAGRGDRLGLRYSGLAREAGASLLYTVGAVQDGAGTVVGAIVLAQKLAVLLSGLPPTPGSELALYDFLGTPLAATTNFPSWAPPATARQREAALAGYSTLRLGGGGTQDEIVLVPWRIRAQLAGYAAVVVPGASLPRSDGGLFLITIGISLVALVLVGLVGWYVTQSITRPLRRLLLVTNEVARGHLTLRVRPESGDEIGRLTESFNTMTAALEDRTRRLSDSAEATVLALAATIEARDPYTHGHSLRVAAYSLILATAAGAEEGTIETIRRGCLVHDIGKIGVPDGVLGKPGQLLDHEVIAMRRHPEVGHQVLRGLDWQPEVLEIVLQHHERWDGLGYPGGLHHEQISPLARLVAITDSLDAMTSRRPYRNALPFEEAVRRIEAGSGSQFEPQAVAVFRAAESDLRRCWESFGQAEAPARPVLLEVIA